MDATGIEAIVCSDIAERQKLGLNKYGVSVADNPGDLEYWLTHAYQETLDNAVYLRRAIEKIRKEKAADGSWVERKGIPSFKTWFTQNLKSAIAVGEISETDVTFIAELAQLCVNQSLQPINAERAAEEFVQTWYGKEDDLYQEMVDDLKKIINGCRRG